MRTLKKSNALLDGAGVGAIATSSIVIRIGRDFFLMTLEAPPVCCGLGLASAAGFFLNDIIPMRPPPLLWLLDGAEGFIERRRERPPYRPQQKFIFTL